jgi:hypothetical protein
VLRVAVRRGLTGGFATATLLRRVNRGIGGLSVAIDARGEATVAWVERAVTRGLEHGHIALRAAFRPPRGRWSSVRTISYLSPYRYAFPRLAAAPDGRVVLVFNAGVKRAPGVAAAWRRPGRWFGAIQDLNTGARPRGYFFDLQALFDASGKAYVSGVRDCDTPRSAGVLMTSPPGTTRFAATRLVAPAPVRDLHFALTATGRGELAWLAVSCSTTEYYSGPVHAAAVRGGSADSPAVVSDVAGFGIWLAGGPNGAAEAAWTSWPPRMPNGVILAARSNAAGTFAAPFSPSDGVVALAADARGNQLVGAVQTAAAGVSGFPSVVGVRTPDGAVSAAPLTTTNITGIGTAMPQGAGIAVAVPTRTGIRLTSWRP